VAARDLALRDLEAALQQGREYKAALTAVLFDPELDAPCYATVPPHPSLRYSSRDRFVVKEGNFTFMRRQGSRKYSITSPQGTAAAQL
jgi:hypothetical protein